MSVFYSWIFKDHKSVGVRKCPCNFTVLISTLLLFLIPLSLISHAVLFNPSRPNSWLTVSVKLSLRSSAEIPICNPLKQWFSKCSHQTNSSDNTWALTGDSNSFPQPTDSGTLEVRLSNLGVHKHSGLLNDTV